MPKILYVFYLPAEESLPGSSTMYILVQNLSSYYVMKCSETFGNVRTTASPKQYSIDIASFDEHLVEALHRILFREWWYMR